MAMNLEAVLRIAAKVVGLDKVTALEKGIAGAESVAKDAKSTFGAVVSSASWQAAAAAAGAFVVGLGLATRAAIDFESSMADVRKVVSGIDTPEAFAEISQEILELSTRMPIAAKGFAEIYAAAGQSGIARGELKAFAELVAQVGVAFDMTAGEAGRALAQMRVALGLSNEQLRGLADAMNYVSNNTGASAANLVEFMSRAGAVGKLAGLSGEQTIAFGAAMVQTGINTEVAATSFNNMVKALSRGPSMTDRQIDALRRLGYTMVDAQTVEKELTRAAESESRLRVDAATRQRDEVVRIAEDQSRQRLETARNETDQLSREISRRYRNELQALQDSWEDQATVREDGLRDQADAQVKALEREQNQLVRAAQERARINDQSADLEVERIRDAYASRIEAVRDGLDRTLTVERRAARDRQQVVRDRLQDQQDAESKAAQDRLAQAERVERARLEAVQTAADERLKTIQAEEKATLETLRASAKKTGEQMAKESSQGFADRLQKDAIGTITEVLSKIANLPREQQVSVLSDMFGDEARGLAPLIANLGELQRIIGLAGDTAASSGSVLEEFGVRSETTANKLQLAKDQIEAMQIEIGTKLLPKIVELTQAFEPLIGAITKFITANPELTGVLLAVGGIAAALVIAAPGILAAITLVGNLAGAFKGVGLAIAALNIGGLIAGWLPAIAGALGGIVAAFKVFGAVLLAIFSGPGGWTVLAVAAVVAMVGLFHEPILKFIGWFGDQFKPMIDAMNEFAKFSRGIMKTLFTGLIALGYELFIKPWVRLWTIEAQSPIDKLWTYLQGLWPMFAQGFTDMVIKPIQSGWQAVSEFIPNATRAAGLAIIGIFTSIAESVMNVFRGILTRIANGVNTVAARVNRVISAYNAVSPVDIALVPRFSIPAFAKGAVVDRKTLAYVGDGGETEYIIPQSKMAAASSRFLSGARGSAVIPASSSAPAATSTQRPTIKITTGPVMEFDGQRYVTIDDYERGLLEVADGMFGRLRTPQARQALGMS
jgi:hypothetical protein